jgi:hypothetical protein
MSSVPSDPQSVVPASRPKEAGGGARRISDFWQWLGMSGDAIGTRGTLRRTFLYSYLCCAVLVAVINALNVITDAHDIPGAGIAGPIVWPGGSLRPPGQA